MGYRADFIKKFGQLFTADAIRKHYEGYGIESMELDEEREFVTIYFIGGKKKYVNVEMDSLMCAVYDIVRTIL